MMGTRKAVLGGLLLIGPLIVAGVSAAARAEEQVTIGMSPSITSTLFFVADEKGYFAGEGLKAVLDVNPSGGNAIIEDLFKGKIDLASTTSYIPTTQSFLRKDFKIIAMPATSVNDNIVVARRDAGIREVEDLKGKRVGVTATGVARYSLNLLLLRHGLRFSDILISYLPAEESVKRLAEGALDAICVFGIYVLQAEKALGANAVRFSDEMLLRITTVMMAVDGTIRGRPSVLAKVVRALVLAEGFVGGNPQEALAIVARRLGTDPERLRQQWHPSRFRLALDQSLVIDLENMAQWQIDSGLSKAAKAPNYLDFIHFRTLEEIDPKRITVIR